MYIEGISLALWTTLMTLRKVDAIAKVPGIDVLFVGSFDLGNKIGHSILDGTMHEELNEASRAPAHLTMISIESKSQKVFRTLYHKPNNPPLAPSTHTPSPLAILKTAADANLTAFPLSAPNLARKSCQSNHKPGPQPSYRILWD